MALLILTIKIYSINNTARAMFNLLKRIQSLNDFIAFV